MSPTVNIFGQLLLLAVLLAAGGLFAYRVGRLYRLMMAAQPVTLGGDTGTRLRRFVSLVLVQTKMFDRPGIAVAHFLIFWGFVILTLALLQVLADGLIHGVRIPIIGSRFFIAINDILAVAVIASLIFAAFRRRSRPRGLTTQPDAWVILGMIGAHLSSLLLAEGFAAAAFGNGDPHWSLAGLVLGGPLGAFGQRFAEVAFVAFYWVHILLVLGLLVYIPLSKHFHVLVGPVNVYLKGTKSKGELRKIENIEEAEHFGVSKVQQFTWKDILDGYACTECGRCTNACPANITGKPLDPKKIVVDMRLSTYAQGDMRMAMRHEPREITAATPLIGEEGLIKDEELWSCTTCMACVEACPVAIEQVPKIIDMRRNLVLEETRFPAELTKVFNSLERNSNPFGLRARTRADWAKGLGLKIMSDHADEPIDVLYWVGCYGSFDERNQKVARALSKVLQAGGINFGILGTEEGCTGDPARRAGNEYLYQVLAQGNVETLQGYGVKKIVTACPHCMNTIKNEYPQFGGDFEVVHHSQFIADLIKSGRIKLEEGTDKKSITFHDPCYLGRYNDVYEAPREVISGLGVEVTEMRRARNKSLCCGGGGGRTFMEERIGKKMSHNRLGDVLETGCGTLAAGCPFCITMFEDAIVGTDSGEKVRVEDIAELVAARLPQPAPAEAAAD
jgi:Fe-S oxidoreductase